MSETERCFEAVILDNPTRILYFVRAIGFPGFIQYLTLGKSCQMTGGKIFHKRNSAVLFILFLIQGNIAFGQLDFRDASVIKANGDSLVGKVFYYNSFLHRSSILFKDKNGKQRISIADLRRLSFADHGTFEVVKLTPDSNALIQVIIDGDIAVYSSRRSYYLFKDSLHFLDNQPVQVTRNGRSVGVRSKKYLSTLHLAFLDCTDTIPYKPLGSNLKLKPLIKLTKGYASCRNRRVRELYPKSSIEVMPYVGSQSYSMTSDRFRKILSQSGSGKSFGLSILKSFRDVRDLNLRVDFNYQSGEIIHHYEDEVTDSPVPAVERRRVVFGRTGLQIPMGLQYYIKRNDLGIYIAGGFQLSFFKSKVFDAPGSYVFKYDGATVHQPSPAATFHLDTKFKPFSEFWLTLGSDYKLSGRLRVNAELKVLRSKYGVTENKQDMFEGSDQTLSTLKVTTVAPQIGLKFKLR